jgi:hypothetical protein
LEEFFIVRKQLLDVRTQKMFEKLFEDLQAGGLVNVFDSREECRVQCFDEQANLVGAKFWRCIV